jgi:hypothetical protein
MDDGTAWEEIGGMVPARRESSLPAAPSSSVAQRLRDIHDLVPVSRGEFFEAVAPCLTLAAGVGMSQSDQRAWLEAAYQALDGIPIALLQRGARAALLRADHPSKIIPTITKEIGEDWQWRKEYRPSPSPEADPPPPKDLMAHRGQPMTDEETDQLNRQLESLGATARYRPDGSRYRIQEAA